MEGRVQAMDVHSEPHLIKGLGHPSADRLFSGQSSAAFL